jgi:spectinomycin phosphotransferase
VVADDETPYFCKLKRGIFDETSVALPNFLSEQGIGQIIPPLATKTGQLRAELDEFKTYQSSASESFLARLAVKTAHNH